MNDEKTYCHICGEEAEIICTRCEQQFCDKCSAVYDQFTQIDYDCCINCAESMKWRD